MTLLVASFANRNRRSQENQGAGIILHVGESLTKDNI